MKRLMVVDVVAISVGLWLAASPSLIANGTARMGVLAVCVGWLLLRWSNYAIGRSRNLLSSDGSTARKAEGYFLRVILVLMVTIAIVIGVRVSPWW